MDSVDICRDHEIWDPFLGCQRIGNIGGFVLQNVLFGFVIQRALYWIPLILSVVFGTAIIKIHQIFEKKNADFCWNLCHSCSKIKGFALVFPTASLNLTLRNLILWPFEIKSRLGIGIFLGFSQKMDWTYRSCNMNIQIHNIHMYIYIHINIDIDTCFSKSMCQNI